MIYANGKTIRGDCLKKMRLIEDGSVDMILCDLPYGTTGNKWDCVIPFAPLWEQYQRIIKKGGVIALFSQGIFTANLIASNKEWFRYKFIWVKNKPTSFLLANKQPMREYEEVCIFYGSQSVYYPVMWKGKPYTKKGQVKEDSGTWSGVGAIDTNNDGTRFPTDTLFCESASSEGPGRAWHPTQKPVALGRYLIRTYTRPGETVLDNAFGSGSFLVAASMENRRFIGIELNEKNRKFKNEPIDLMKIADKRLREVEKMKKLGTPFPSLFDQLQPSAKSHLMRRTGIVNDN